MAVPVQPANRIEFTPNKEIGIGVEIELQLINPETWDLKSAAPKILEKCMGKPGEFRIKSELFQSMLEIDTPICKNAFEVGASLRSSLNCLRTTAASENVEIMMSGTHPFAVYADRRLTQDSRYFSLVDRNQWIARRLQIFGLHVHLGMRDGDHAIAMSNALCHYLPFFLALSASSPYWHGEDTGLASCRITFFEAIPTGGHPYISHSWAEYQELIEKMIFAKSITSLKDLWWDIRLNPTFGTVEIRVADCPPTITEVEALVAVIHALALFIDSELSAGRRFSPPPEWILRENKWRASRHGVQCDLIKDLGGISVPFFQVWDELKEVTKGEWTRLGYNSYFDFMDILVQKGPSYYRQRHHYNEKRLETVIKHLIRENKIDYPEW